MPVAGPSRLRRNRAPSSDRIEEDPSAQMENEEVDDEEQEQPRRSTKAAKKDTKPDRAKLDEVSEDILEDFGNQPLDRQQHQKLNGMAEDWSMMRRQIHVNSYSLIRDVAASLAEFTHGEKGEKAITNIDNIMKELIDTETELTVHEKTLNELHQKLAGGEEISDVVGQYQNGWKTKFDEYKSLTSRQKYAKNEEYTTFRQAIFEVQNPDTAMPPVVEFLPHEDGDDSDDDDVQVGGVTQDYKCPITLMTLVDPYTSSTCGHSFSKDAILQFLGNVAGKKCPASGCNQVLTKSALRPNKELAKKAKDAARRERMREEDSDGEEVVE